MRLAFDDGVKFNLDGDLRAEKRSDGWYIVGKGMLMPVDSYEEALEFLAEEREREKAKKNT